MTAPTTVDAFLGGRVEAVQPAEGHHRSGLEAVLLAASLPQATRGTIVDLGAGAGVAGLCAAARCPDARVVLVERNRDLVACASASLKRMANRDLASRVSVETADVGGGAPPSFREAADEVLVNPPFYDPTSNSASPKAPRADAHVLAESGLDPWLRAGAALLKPRGRITVIFRADGLDELLAACRRRFGGIDVLPILPRANLPAHRIIVSGRKGSRAALRLLPPLVLHGNRGNAFLPQVEAILREGAGIGDVHEPWRAGR